MPMKSCVNKRATQPPHFIYSKKNLETFKKEVREFKRRLWRNFERLKKNWKEEDFEDKLKIIKAVLKTSWRYLEHFKINKSKLDLSTSQDSILIIQKDQQAKGRSRKINKSMTNQNSSTSQRPIQVDWQSQGRI